LYPADKNASPWSLTPQMRPSDTRPRIVLGLPARERDSYPVLIVAGATSSDIPNSPCRLVILQKRLELGRGLHADFPCLPEDRLMSRRHARVVRMPNGRYAIADLGSTNGTWLNGVRLQPGLQHKLQEGAVIMVGSQVFVFRRVKDEQLKALQDDACEPFGPTATRSPAMAMLARKLRLFARTSMDVLLTGETGVGKEVHAEALHRASGRKGAFVTINCAAIPEQLLESELFGYARGAHSTAAQPKQGLFEQAEGGTLFLDELGEMPPAAQSKLLRFLQSREVLSLGTTQPRALNVRVVAATHRTTASEGVPGLRHDLAARLGPAPVHLPPLRDRVEDVGSLTSSFLRRRERRFEPEAYLALFLHTWKGNVRELSKVLEVAQAVAAEDAVLAREHLPPEIAGRVAAPTRPENVRRDRPSREDLETLLSRHRGRVAKVARELGRQRTLVWRWMREHQLTPDEYRQ
jgi:transcriptional regulator with PAS, ATPase and Fis domain